MLINGGDYRLIYSTEIAQLKRVNDFLVADADHEEVLVLLDYTASFETIDHVNLLDIIEHEYGIKGLTLKWPASIKGGDRYTRK